MDIVSITDPGHELARQWVQIVQIEENDDGSLSIVANEYPRGVANSPAYVYQQPGGYSANYDEDPGDVTAAVLFEPTSELAGGAEVWAAVSGGPQWGGCDVFVSGDDQAYAYIGQIVGGARVGELTAALPSGAATDVTNVLGVDLTASRGQLLSGTTANAQALDTLCWVDGELLAFSTANLTAPFEYDLSYLVRGAQGSKLKAHSTGAPFARLDGGIFKFPYDLNRIGTTLYIKFVSFNLHGGGRQTLAEVDPYSILLTGIGRYVKPGTVNESALETGIKATIAQSIANVAAVSLASKALIDKWITAKQAGDAFTSQLRRVEATASNANASIAQYQILQAQQNLAVAALIDALTAQVAANSAGLVTEQSVRAAQDSAIASSITALTTTVGTNTASIGTLTTSINGVKVQFGVTGTINGVTGGFVFTGIQKLDGSVSYSVEINGNLIVSGTITGTQIAALTVDTVNLKVGSVDINKLVAGAATSISALGATSLAGSAAPNGTPLLNSSLAELVLSVTLPKTTKCLIMCVGTITSTSNAGSGTLPSCFAQLARGSTGAWTGKGIVGRYPGTLVSGTTWSFGSTVVLTYQETLAAGTYNWAILFQSSVFTITGTMDMICFQSFN